MSIARKSGSGRKRKCDSLTSGDYARKLEAHMKLKWRPGLTREEKAAFKKEQRSLKNRLSALKSREKKRAQMEALQQQIAVLQQQVEHLTQENSALKRGMGVAPSSPQTSCQGNGLDCSIFRSGTCTPGRNPKRRRSSLSSGALTATLSSTKLKPAKLEGSEELPLPSLDELIPQQSTMPKVKIEPCAHNSGSALGDAMEDFAFDVFDSLDSTSLFESDSLGGSQKTDAPGMPQSLDDSFFSLLANPL